eukprot:4884162-Pyramimonas_sp.AAC.1
MSEKLFYHLSYDTWRFRSGHPLTIGRGAVDRKREDGRNLAFREGHPHKMALRVCFAVLFSSWGLLCRVSGVVLPCSFALVAYSAKLL